MKSAFKSILNISPTVSQSELTSAVDGVVSHSPVGDAEFFFAVLGRLEERFGSQAYSEFFQSLFHIEIEQHEAERIFHQMMSFHQKMEQQAGISLDFRVSALQYLMSVEKLLVNPIVMEAEQYEKVFHDTVTDELTRLYNSRFFKNSLSREIERAGRQNEPLSLIFFDLDGFKAINDQHGHAVGDEALKIFSQAILSSVRNTDFPCRYGGDEFVIIAPSTTKEGASLLANRIKESFLNLQKKLWKYPHIKIGISGGIASYPWDATQADRLLQKADEALYMAKQGGKNRIETITSDRRRYNRRKVLLSGTIIHPEADKAIVVRNVSEGGFLIQGNEPVSMGSIVEIKFKLDRAQDAIQFMGKVTFAVEEKNSKSFSYGVSILAMPAQHQHVFQTFLATHP